MRCVAATVCLVSIVLPAMAQVRMPWIHPGNFGGRLSISDAVVSGTIEDTSEIGVQTFDHIELLANVARVQVDRIFQGSTGAHLQFVWYKLYVPPASSGGVVGSLPPVANFRAHERYLVFLKHRTTGWVVAMPLYGIEFRLAAAPPAGAMADLSQATADQQDDALAQELETAALLIPAPQPGLTGEAVTYFPSIFDLLGGCAEPFYRRFLSSPSPELRRAALNWLQQIQSRHMTCKSSLGEVN